MRFAFFMLALAACAQQKMAPTALIVRVTTDLLVPAEADAIEIEVSGAADSVTRTVTQRSDLPIEVAIEPRTASGRNVEIVARALSADSVRVSRRVSTSFIVGEVRVVAINLERTCLGRTDCRAPETCITGVCGASAVSSADLPSWVPPAARDAGVIRDSGADARDASSLRDINVADLGRTDDVVMSDVVVVAPDTTVPVEAGRGCPAGCGANSECCAGVCVPVGCELDGNPCTVGQCMATGCVEAPASGMACDPRNLCTTGDMCTNGVCGGGTRRSCPDDGVACTEDLCQNGTGCTSIPRDARCTAGQVCTVGGCTCEASACSSAAPTCQIGRCSGPSCVFGSAPDATACSGADPCAVYACRGGGCVIVGPKCTMRSRCESFSCRASDGTCLYEMLPDTVPCQGPDDTPCSPNGDVCQGGFCASGPECPFGGNVCCPTGCAFDFCP